MQVPSPNPKQWVKDLVLLKAVAVGHRCDSDLISLAWELHMPCGGQKRGEKRMPNGIAHCDLSFADTQPTSGIVSRNQGEGQT